MLRGPVFVQTKKAREAWDSMSHEQRKGHARATPLNSALSGKLKCLQQLHDELVEDAIETHSSTSQLEGKIRSSRLLPLLDDYAGRLPRLQLHQPRSPDKIPRAGRTPIDPAIIPMPIHAISEELKSLSRICQREIGV